MAAFIPQWVFLMKFDHSSPHSYSSPALGSKHNYLKTKAVQAKNLRLYLT